MNNYKKSLEKWIFPFFIKKYKVTYLLTLILVIAGIYSVNEIPKESDPTINIPLVSINTTYDWIDARTIDEEITEKIEETLEDVDGISSVSSTSSEWRSSINIEIDNTFDIDEVLKEIEDAVDSVALPSEAEEPDVVQREFTSTDIFDTVLYAKEWVLTFEELLAKAENLKKSTEWRVWIREVQIDANTIFDIRIIANKDKLDSLWLSLDNISTAIANNNLDKPLWSYEIWDKKYDFRFTWEIKEIKDFLQIPVIKWSSSVRLKDVAEIELYYWDEQINKFWMYDDFRYNYIALTYFKNAWDNIFDIAWNAKNLIDKELSKSLYEWIKHNYTNDESASIIEDYKDLVKSALSTVFVVFLTLIFFVWIREATIATFLLPLAFLISFIVVWYQWETLNFMTNFAFVLSFWIAIDTIIIIVEWASEKMKEGFSKNHAVLIALKEFKSPLIIWTLTTLAAFIPILSLPWMFGIMLSFIPNIVFITLISTLFVALVLTWALFILFNKEKAHYEVDEERESVRPIEEKELLEEDRKWKHLLWTRKIPLRDKIYLKYSSWYKIILVFILKRRWSRVITTLTPIVLLVFLIVTLVPQLWFEIFPSGRKDRLSMTITPPEWKTIQEITSDLSFIEETFASYKEVDNFTLKITESRITAWLNFTPQIERTNAWLLNNEDIQLEFTKVLNKKLKPLWYNVWVRAWMRWGWTTLPVWIKLVTDNASNYEELIWISEDFENFLSNNELVSETSVSASSTLWQIEFTIDMDKASIMWLDKRTVVNAVSWIVREKTIWTFRWILDDHDVILMTDKFKDYLTPNDIENINLYVWGQTIKASSIISYEIKSSAPSIQREDWYITVSVSAWVLDTKNTSKLQKDLNTFAEEYSFPNWLSFVVAWENEENKDLINTVIASIFVAFFFIFSVLVFQFNSYAQPAIILYSVFMAASWVIVGLYVTWNPLSMPAGIWFISLMWIVVNDAIVYIDKINRNISRGMELLPAISNAWVSRLNPILVTTITTVAWILPIALQDPMWAWLWFTIAFGLVTGSLMTLFAVPTLYYSIMFKKNKN